MDKKFGLQRVDIQVSLLVAIMVIFSCLIIFMFSYTLSYNEMIDSLANRVDDIVNHLDRELDASIFEDIENAEDMNNPLYQETQAYLSMVRDVSSAQYLYTAIKNEQGELIYHIDGLLTSHADFRKPGDLIEPDFVDDLSLALNDQIVMPREILNTAWGDVFVAYHPLHDENGEVIAAIGIEFPASAQYSAYRFIRYMAPGVILITCLGATLISRYLFRRLSNPHFRNIFNTDSLTGIKNRNAFDLDTHNKLQTEGMANVGIVLADLNGLKQANDLFGHKMGDFYIKKAAEALSISETDDYVVYRIGGDEFAAVFANYNPQDLENYMITVKERLSELCKDQLPQASISMGYAICQGNDLSAWEKAQNEADKAMYKDKKLFYEHNKRYDNRS